jgi:Nucleotidyl transferase AbiEii toxin, Type IV TA system
VSPTPQHGSPAGDAFLAIQKLARSTGGNVQELLTLYALEGLLARVAESRHREDFVLKGGVLLAAFSLRRPTKDIDLQATGIANDPTTVLTRVTDIAAIDIDDGLTFDQQTITAQPIREDDTYAGVRVRLVATLGRAQIPVGIDVNFGDPIWPAPTEITMPRLVQIGQRPVRILGYPLSMVIAEKIVTALERGEANTRWRDFADVLTISGTHEILASELRAALETVAAYRGTTLRPLHLALAAMPEVAQTKWSIWRRRQAHADQLPEEFDDVLRTIAAFTDPVLDDPPPDEGHWNPTRQTWEMEST